MSVPDVSVVIPTRDRWTLLPRAVGTALGQRGVTMEVIVVDDGSDRPAPPLPILDDPRVTQLRQPPLGVAAARNRGARHAMGGWLAFLDDDDIWAPQKLASLLTAAEQTEVGFAYSSVLMIEADLTPLLLDPAPQPAGLLRRLVEFNAIPGGGSNVIVEKELFDHIGGFDESLSYVADWDAWLRLSQAAPATRVEDPLMAYSCHAGNWALRREEAESDYVRFSRKHENLIRLHGAALNRLKYEQYIAVSHVRAGQRRVGGRLLVKTGLRQHDLRTATRGLMVLVAPRSVIELRRRRRRRRAPAWLSAHQPIATAP